SQHEIHHRQLHNFQFLKPFWLFPYVHCLFNVQLKNSLIYVPIPSVKLPIRYTVGPRIKTKSRSMATLTILILLNILTPLSTPLTADIIESETSTPTINTW